MAIIEAQGVFKNYGPISALSDFSLSIESGKVFGLLGPNGAGKTTFIKCLMNLVSINTGSIKINGKLSHEPASRAGIGLLPEKFSFYPFYTALATVEFFASMNKMPSFDRREKAQKALERMRIGELANRKLNTMSKGQLQRVGLASLLVCDHDVYILDEPFSGLDPIGIKDLKDLIVELKERGKTIFLNSHILSDVEIICDEMAILNKGRCLIQGNIKEILQGKKLEDYFYSLVQGGVQ
jgi:ABC-2 type transport system ATP-binding protein